MTRRCGSWLLVGAVVGVAALGPGSPAQAAPQPGPAALAPPVCRDDEGTDFDADGRLDVAVGVPSEDRGEVAGAGAVEVRYPCSTRAAQSLVLPKPHAHDGFGTALAVGLLNGDRYLDLAVGVPGLDVRGHRNAGGVAFFYGSATGLRYGKTITQASAHVGGAVQSGARFGQVLWLSIDPYQRSTRLRIGEPGRTVSGQAGAGGVVDHVLVRGRYRARGSGELTLATKGVPGSPHAGDAMGASIDTPYRIGIPNRTVNGAKGAGAVLESLTPRSDFTMITEASPGVPGTPEPGDHFGASLSGYWIGVPGETVDGLAGAGVIVRPGENLLLDQHDLDPSQTVEAGDHFGATMTEIGYVEDGFAPYQLLAGAPGEDVAGHADAGTVSVIGVFDNVDLGPFELGTPYGPLQPAEVVTGARFGAVLARNGMHTVQVGAPGARGGRLSRYVAPNLWDGPLTLSATQAQTAGTPETGDRYGGAAVLTAP